MYRIIIENEFSAAHKVKEYPGKCAFLHGHNWKVVVSINFKKLDNIGISIDFKKAKKILKEYLDKWDHMFLNELSPFDQLNPTAENLAKKFFEDLKEEYKQYGGEVYSVKVYETPNNCVEYLDE